MPPVRYPILFLQGPTRSGRFTSPQQGGSSLSLHARDHVQHAELITRKLQTAWEAADNQQAVAHATRSGVYLDFYSEPGFDLALNSLEARKSGIRLLNVRRETANDQTTTIATVYVPNEKRAHFLRKAEVYATEDVPGHEERKPKNKQLVESISDVRLAMLQSFWQDRADMIPGDAPDWVEVWLSTEDQTVVETFLTLCREAEIQIGEGRLVFPERTVILIRTNRNGLATLQYK